MTDLTTQVDILIRSRRSVKPRCLNGKSIDDKLVWQILENANWAPTHGLTQPWRFKVFTGSGLEKLADFQADLYKKTTPESKFDSDKYQRMRQNLLQSSHVIVICMKRQISEKIPEIEEIEAVACSVQNMCLTATAYGICSFWGSGGVTLYLGYSDYPMPTSKREPIQEKVEWIS
jgi:nitroreductase